MKKYLVVAMFALLSTAAVAADKGTGLGLEAYSGGAVGIAKYETNWAAGLATQMTGSNIDGLDQASSQLFVWGEWRKDVGSATNFVLGAQVGFGFNGKSNDNERTSDTYLGVFTGFENAINDKVQLKGLVTLGNRSFDTSGAKANNVTALEAVLGATYFL